jgi:hypothetical protein
MPKGTNGFARSLCLLAAWEMVGSQSAVAGPQYRTGDADTVSPGTLGVRVGIVGMQHDSNSTDYEGPLLRLNLGLGSNSEFSSSLDYAHGRLNDGGLALKHVARRDSHNLGFEIRALLPVAAGQSGIGIESHFLATLKRDPTNVHLNLGGFYDPRFAGETRGWRASVLGEKRFAHLLAGLELIAGRVSGEPTFVQAGAGLVAPISRYKLRAGVHLGLIGAAPDVTASIWVTTEGKLW